MFVGIIKKLRREGKDQATHYPPISQEDLDILRKGDCYNLNNPKSLQMKVWFDIHFNFIRRGRENDRALSKNSFELRTDGAGRRFLQLGYIETEKNHQGGPETQRFYSNARMYENKTRMCPVANYLFYRSKLHPGKFCLWQKPRQARPFATDEEWYCNVAVGPDTLGKMMTTISKECKLSRTYTNHSIRSTAITELFHAGVPSQHIQNMSGHRNAASMMHYAHDSSEAQKATFSAILQHGHTTPHQHTQQFTQNTSRSTNMPVQQTINNIADMQQRRNADFVANLLQDQDSDNDTTLSEEPQEQRTITTSPAHTLSRVPHPRRPQHKSNAQRQHTITTPLVPLNCHSRQPQDQHPGRPQHQPHAQQQHNNNITTSPMHMQSDRRPQHNINAHHHHFPTSSQVQQNNTVDVSKYQNTYNITNCPVVNINNY